MVNLSLGGGDRQGQRFQGCPWLHSEPGVSQGSKRSCLKKTKQKPNNWAGEMMAHWLGVYAAIGEDLDSISSTHTTAHTYL